MFLVAQYIKKPLAVNEKGQFDEIVSFTRKLNNSELASCNVILDLMNEDVIKCRLNGQEDNDYVGILEYFKKNYTKEINQMLEIVATYKKFKNKDKPVVGAINVVEDPIAV